MHKFRSIIVFLISVTVLANFSFENQSKAADTSQQPANDTVQQQATLQMLESILGDPMLPTNVHGLHLQQNTQRRKGILPYVLVDPNDLRSNSVNQAHLFPRGGGAFDFDLFLANDDQTMGAKEPDWAKLEPQWDAFVARYWPGLERVSDWRREILRYRPGRGLFTIQYALKDKEAEVFRVMLDIRLSDGKIGGVATSDVRPLLAGQPVISAPSPEALLASFRQAWTATNTTTPIHNLRFYDRSRDIFPDPQGGARFIYQINILAEDEKNQELIINASYDEKAGTTKIGPVSTQEELNQLHQQPYTNVADTKPAWSSDGKQLYFATTRNVTGYPWWQRGTLVQSIAVAQMSGGKATSLELISPIKTMRGDYGLYDAPSPSPSNHYLSGAFGGNQDHLFVLDLQAGNLYLPQRDPKWRESIAQKWHLPPNQLTGELPWQMKGVVWSSENSLLVSMLFDWPDYDLFLLKHQPAKPPQEWDLSPLDVDRGEAILPCLAQSGKVVAYGHSVPQTRSEVKEDKPKQWQFVVASFDAPTAKLGESRSLNLSSEPLSIAWDSINNRWLVVTQREMLWAKEVKGQLQSLPITGLKWNETPLHVTAAAISPQDGKVAIAAELATPKIYEQSKCVVQATIFLWDGKTSQVQPLFDPSVNGLPRYIFPESKNSWAKIVGDVKKFGLSGIVDFVAQ